MVKKLIERIRETQTEVEEQLEREAAEKEAARIAAEEQSRVNGRLAAYGRIPHIEAAIMEKVKHQQYWYSEELVKHNPTSTLAPYWEAYSDYLVKYFRDEGITARVSRLDKYNGSVNVACDFILQFDWLHA